MRFANPLSVVGAIILLGTAKPARPAILADPTVLTICDAIAGTPLHSETSSGCSLTGVLGASATVTGSPLILLQAQATSPGPNAFISASGDARLDYQFQVLGSNNGGLVNVRIDFVLQTFADHNQSLGFATFDLTLGGTGLATAYACTPPGEGGCPANSLPAVEGSVTRQLTVGIAYTIRLRALARAGSNPAQGGAGRSAWATVDPFIYIDPSTPNAALYSIEVSPGIANAPNAVPEPAAASLFAVGGSLLALVRWRRR